MVDDIIIVTFALAMILAPLESFYTALPKDVPFARISIY